MRLLKFIGIITIFCCFINNNTIGQVKFSLKGGPSFTKGVFDNSNNKVAINFHIGVSLQIPVNTKFYFRPELMFSRKGWKFPNNEFNKNASMIINYLTLPLLLGYKINDNVSLFLGIEPAYKINEKLKPNGSWYEYENIDFGLNIGANYLITSNFGVEVRYVYGVKTLINDKITYTDEYGNILKTVPFKDGYNRALLISIIYNIK